MITIQSIFEQDGIDEFLEKRNLLVQYRKAKQYILSGNPQSTRLKQRQPKNSDLWYFRINKQYRAWGFLKNDNDLIIVKIDDHS